MNRLHPGVVVLDQPGQPDASSSGTPVTGRCTTSLRWWSLATDCGDHDHAGAGRDHLDGLALPLIAGNPSWAARGSTSAGGGSTNCSSARSARSISSYAETDVVPGRRPRPAARRTAGCSADPSRSIGSRTSAMSTRAVPKEGLLVGPGRRGTSSRPTVGDAPARSAPTCPAWRPTRSRRGTGRRGGLHGGASSSPTVTWLPGESLPCRSLTGGAARSFIEVTSVVSLSEAEESWGLVPASTARGPILRTEAHIRSVAFRQVAYCPACWIDLYPPEVPTQRRPAEELTTRRRGGPTRGMPAVRTFSLPQPARSSRPCRTGGMTSPTLTFLGAAGTVTGSRFLVETPRVARPGRRRALPGSQGAAEAELGGVPRRPRDPRRGGARPMPTSTTAATCRGWSARGSRGRSCAPRRRRR